MDIQSLNSLPVVPQQKVLSPEKRAKLEKVAIEMEAVWVAQILKEARPKGNMMDSSFAAQTFQDMLGQQLAQDMAKKGVLGLADTLVRQVLQEPSAPDTQTTAATEPDTGSH